MLLHRVGFVGWRGMVGSVLLERMIRERDFDRIDEPVFYTTSQGGQPGPDIGREVKPLADARDIESLCKLDIIVTCQGGGYTSDIHHRLRQQGWSGYWIDAASTLRMAERSTIILDPVNLPVIEQGLADGHKDFIGGNCTVSLMMMALDGLFSADLIEWMTVMTYQAISGGGARQMRELVEQMGVINLDAGELLADPDSSILDIDGKVAAAIRSAELPKHEIGYPLAGNLLPWIGNDPGSGVSQEEQKGSMESNKILGRRGDTLVPIESTCIRIGTMRCHSQAFTIQLKADLPLDEIQEILSGANDWVTLISNEREASLNRLCPAATSGTLDIPVGRLKKLNMAKGLISAFTVGDQLLWGAAEPLRRMLGILHQY